MTKALGLAASIIGLLHVCRKVADFTSHISDSPEIAARVLSEMNIMSILFSRVQGIIYGMELNREQNSDDIRAVETADDLIVILIGCVCSFAKLDSMMQGIQNGRLAKLGNTWRITRWALKEKDLDKVISEIQNHKIC
ncbi:Protein of unknown function [Pyronema omphalodes CBS 100304]|uniref:Uncharacterized protein n=1 Tax=Pyronema omphalodes (strain CBS 100304) TaxID=1076935 RepID=U4L0U0_PYROM|nr:Protein of unknown function [Pyronema omphalodes CBS 100304]